jgi:CMP-N,N'-diacetyllegionaminic acid synthase
MSFNNKKVYGLIPARAGSKGIPGKNLYDILGKKLIDYTLDAALESAFIDEIYVSSDSDKILSHVENRAYCIKRPQELSQDNSTAVEVVEHFQQFIKKEHRQYDDYFLIYLQPTSPLRSSTLIDKSFEELSYTNSTSLISLVKNNFTPFKSFSIDHDGLAHSLFNEKLTNQSRQNLPETYRANGAIYIFTISRFNENKGFPSNNSHAFIMDEVCSLDIDTYEDIEKLKSNLAEMSLK